MAIAASSRKEETVKMELTFSMFSSYPGVGKRKDGAPELRSAPRGPTDFTEILGSQKRTLDSLPSKHWGSSVPLFCCLERMAKKSTEARGRKGKATTPRLIRTVKPSKCGSQTRGRRAANRGEAICVCLEVPQRNGSG